MAKTDDPKTAGLNHPPATSINAPMGPAAVPLKQDADLYIMRWRRGSAQPETGFLRATSKEKAEEVGRAYCASVPGSRFIKVDRAVLADESFLEIRDQESKDRLTGAA